MRPQLQNHAPSVEAHDQLVAGGQLIAATSLFTAHDPDGDRTISLYELTDNSPGGGRWIIDDTRMPDGVQTIIVTPAQLRNIAFLAGRSGEDTLSVRAFDGVTWSAKASFTIGVVNATPTISGSNHAFAHDTAVGLGSLVSIADADGPDDLQSLVLTDGNADPTSGHWVVGGQAFQGGKVTVAASQIGSVFWKGGSTTAASIDPVSVSVVDAHGATASIQLTYTTLANHAPVVTAADAQIVSGASILLSDLIQIADADGDSIKYFGVDWYDDGARNVMLMRNGVVYDGYVDFTPEQFAEVRIVGVAPGGLDGVSIRAQDAKGEWSAASWSHIGVS